MIYNDSIVEQIRTSSFVENRLNVSVYVVSDVGKLYFLAAVCAEACRQNIKCKYIDYRELFDELTVLKGEDLTKYRKHIRYYSRIPLLFIDDFAICRYPEETVNILNHLIKMRTENQTLPCLAASTSLTNEKGKCVTLHNASAILVASEEG